MEIYDPRTDDFVGGWDFTIDYGYGTDEGEMWADVEQIRSAILKCGTFPFAVRVSHFDYQQTESP